MLQLEKKKRTNSGSRSVTLSSLRNQGNTGATSILWTSEEKRRERSKLKTVVVSINPDPAARGPLNQKNISRVLTIQQVKQQGLQGKITAK